jgi:hypothetical protein
MTDAHAGAVVWSDMDEDYFDPTQHVRVVVEGERGHRFGGELAAHVLAHELSARDYAVAVRLVGGDQIGRLIENVTLKLAAARTKPA